MHKQIFALLLSGALLAGTADSALAAGPGETEIILSDSGVTVDGAPAPTQPGGAVYVGGEIIYYHDGTDSAYGEGTQEEQHSAAQAQAHTVVTIARPGTYRLSGVLSQGQIFVDLGDAAKTDPEAVVTLILDGVDITCTVAPAVFFYQVYECDQDWTAYDSGESGDYTPTGTVDTSAAGANVLLAAGSTNTVTGSHVARIYKEGTTKKLHKYDGAFYSRMSMNIGGENGDDSGALSIVADNEGLDSELHLTLNGGTVSIQSQDDGINTNEDGVSVTTINGGALSISAGLGDEGDGIDSNGFLTINGGAVWATSNERSGDGGIDADADITLNGGTVYAFGNRNDSVSRSSEQGVLELSFAAPLAAGDVLQVLDAQGVEVLQCTVQRACRSVTLSSPALEEGQTYSILCNGAQQQYTGLGGGRPEGMEPPEGFTPGQRPEGAPDVPPEGMTPPEGMDRPEGFPPEGGEFPGPEGQSVAGSTDFSLTETVSSFSGLSDFPEGTATRAQAAAALARLAEAEPSKSSAFSDVAPEAWYSGLVGWAAEAGIVQGDGQGRFFPDSPITGAHLELMLTRLAAHTGRDYTPANASDAPLTCGELEQLLTEYAQ